MGITIIKMPYKVISCISSVLEHLLYIKCLQSHSSTIVCAKHS